MCSSRGRCGGGGGDRPSSRSSQSGGLGAHYALCALGVGLIALGIIMIVWTVIPFDQEDSDQSSTRTNNSTQPAPGNNEDDEDAEDHTKSSSVAMVLVGVGAALLLLSICLGVRSKRRAQSQASQPAPAGVPFMDHVPGEEEGGAQDPNTYNVPSYDEVVGSGNYPVRQSNLTRNSSMLPSYEDIIAAVENEGADAANGPSAETPPDAPTPVPAAAAAAAEAQPDGEAAADNAAAAADPNLPTRSSSRASRILRPLLVRRIKSDKLHLKDFRLQIRNPTHTPVTIEPITPPPQYENNIPELG